MYEFLRIVRGAFITSFLLISWLAFFRLAPAVLTRIGEFREGSSLSGQGFSAPSPAPVVYTPPVSVPTGVVRVEIVARGLLVSQTAIQVTLSITPTLVVALAPVSPTPTARSPVVRSVAGQSRGLSQPISPTLTARLLAIPTPLPYLISTIPAASSAGVVCRVENFGADVNVNLRSGAGMDYAIQEQLIPGQIVNVIGQRDAGGYTWWKLENGLWVREDAVREIGDCQLAPLQ